LRKRGTTDPRTADHIAIADHDAAKFVQTFDVVDGERSIENVLGPHDIGLDALEWIVFGRGNLLERCCVDDDVGLTVCAPQPVKIAHVALPWKP
jgi:hypothetical protein